MSNIRYQFKKNKNNSKEYNNLIYVSSSQYGSDWHSALHSHSCAELFYCICGVGEFKVDGKTIPVGSDDLVIVNPHVEHTEISFASNPLEYIVLGVDGLIFEFEENKSSGYTAINFREHKKEISFYINDILKEVKEQPKGWEDVCKKLFDVLLIKMQRYNNYKFEAVKTTRINKDCASAKRFIDEHFSEQLNLENISEHIHVNKYYLAHEFKKNYKTSPISYLNERRIKESEYLLENTDYSLSQISHILGFSSPSYFSQSFKRAKNISPMGYRKQIKLNKLNA